HDSNATLKLCNDLLKEQHVHAALKNKANAKAEINGYQISITKGKITEWVSTKSNEPLPKEDCETLQFLWDMKQKYNMPFSTYEQQKINLFYKMVERFRPQRGSLSKSELNIRDARCRAAKILNAYTEYKFQQQQSDSTNQLAVEYETI